MKKSRKIHSFSKENLRRQELQNLMKTAICKEPLLGNYSSDFNNIFNSFDSSYTLRKILELNEFFR